MITLASSYDCSLASPSSLRISLRARVVCAGAPVLLSGCAQQTTFFSVGRSLADLVLRPASVLHYPCVLPGFPLVQAKERLSRCTSHCSVQRGVVVVAVVDSCRGFSGRPLPSIIGRPCSIPRSAMSLNRIGSIETLTDHSVRRGSDASHRPRRLSFSPVPQEWDPPQPALNKTSDNHDHFYQPQQGRGSPTPSSLSRRLSGVSTPAYEEPVSAFEVPQWKRLCRFPLHDQG